MLNVFVCPKSYTDGDFERIFEYSMMNSHSTVVEERACNLGEIEFEVQYFERATLLHFVIPMTSE